MRRLAALAVVTLLSIAPAAAQSPQDTTKQLAELQREVDQLQAVLLARTGGTAPQVYTYADLAYVAPFALDGDPYVFVIGWAVACAAHPSAGEIVVEIDDVVVVPSSVFRYDRPDVVDVLSKWGVCSADRLVTENGVVARVNVGAYAPGLEHTIRIRVRTAGHLGAASNAQAFTVPIWPGSGATRR